MAFIVSSFFHLILIDVTPEKFQLYAVTVVFQQMARNIPNTSKVLYFNGSTKPPFIQFSRTAWFVCPSTS